MAGEEAKVSRRRFITGMAGAAIAGLAVGGVAGYAATPPKVEKVPVERRIKAGWVYVGPIGDYGWTHAHNQGRLYVSKRMPWLDTVFIESVPEPEVGGVLDRMVAEGANVIFTTSFGFMDPTADAAAKYPNVIFEHCSGYRSGAAGNAPSNMGSYFAEFYQLYYLNGLAAGAMTRTNKIGYVAAHPIPEVIRHINAWVLGAREVNPKVEAYVIWLFSWFDPAKAKEAATSLVEVNKCDVLAFTEDSPSVLEVAEGYQKKGQRVWSFAHYSPMKDFGPTAHLTGQLVDWGPIYEYILNKVHAGTWVSEDIWTRIGDFVGYRWARPVEKSTAGQKEGTVFLAELSPVIPEAVQRLIKERYELMKELKFEPFTGPIRDQDGALRVRAGERLGRDELWTMDWFVEGILSRIPGK